MLHHSWNYPAGIKGFLPLCTPEGKHCLFSKKTVAVWEDKGNECALSRFWSLVSWPWLRWPAENKQGSYSLCVFVLERFLVTWPTFCQIMQHNWVRLLRWEIWGCGCESWFAHLIRMSLCFISGEEITQHISSMRRLISNQGWTLRRKEFCILMSFCLYLLFCPLEYCHKIYFLCKFNIWE